MSENEDAIEVRMAAVADAAAIEPVLASSFAEYRPLYTDEGFAATTPNAEQILQRLGEGPAWVALLNEVIVGTVSAVAQGSALYIRGMAVVPFARGRRVGELLLKEIENYAVIQGHLRLLLSTTPFLGRAIRLYENFGFRRCTGPDDLFGTPLFTMEKMLIGTESE